MKKISLLILFIVCGAKLHAQICFMPKDVYRAGINAGSVCYSDFNNDGYVDLAVANKIGTISVLLGIGNGAFVYPHEFHTGVIPMSICAGDFNNDSLIDLATADGGPWDVQIVFGDGTGSFGFDSVVASITQPKQVISEDFNGDGFADLAVGTPFKMTLLYGNGLGQFTDTTFGTGFGYYSVTSADFNGDSMPDLAMASPPNDIAIMLNTGNGFFGNPLFFPAGNYPNWISSADFNGDGKPDLATANSYSDNVMVFINAGSGNFSLPDSFPVGDNPKGLALADLNGDHIIDIAAVNGNSSDVTILTGDGTGNFINALTLTTDSFPNSIVSADFNGDNENDLAVVTAYNNSDSGNVNVFINCFATGIDEHSIDNISVYPNPSHGIFSVNNRMLGKTNRIEVTDLSGHVIFMKDQFVSTIDLSDQSNGVYILRIFEDGGMYTRKIVII